mgnify:FL=1
MRHRDYKYGRYRGKQICLDKLEMLKHKYFKNGEYEKQVAIREAIKLIKEDEIGNDN